MNKYNSAIHHRRSIRLCGYDYSQDGLYFVTICVKTREYLFGEITNGEIVLNECGKTVENCWFEITQYYPNVVLHDFIVMPNHLHGIIEITNARLDGCRGAIYRAQNDDVKGTDTIYRTQNDDAEGRGAIYRAQNDDTEGMNVIYRAQNDDAKGRGAIYRAQNDDAKGRGAIYRAQNDDAKGRGAIYRTQNDDAEGRGAIYRAQNDDAKGRGAIYRAQNDDAIYKGAINRAPTHSENIPNGGFAHNKNPMFYENLSRIIRRLKGRITFECHKINAGFMWQRNYYEHIIRDYNDYVRIADYIANNPAKWENDCFQNSMT